MDTASGIMSAPTGNTAPGIMQGAAPQQTTIASGAVPLRSGGIMANTPVDSDQSPLGSGNMIANPNMVQPTDPNFTATGLNSYSDSSTGRVGVAQGNSSTGQIALAKPIQFGPQAAPTANLTLSSLPNTIATTPTPPANVSTPVAPTNSLSLTSLSGLLNLGSLAYGVNGLINGSTAALGASGSGIAGGINSAANSISPGTFSAPVPTPAPNEFVPDGVTANPGGITAAGSIGAGMVGGTVAGLLGLAPSSQLESLGTSIGGGLAGGAIGASIGGTVLTIGAGAIGAFVGGFALTALASLFGPHPTYQFAYGAYNPSATGSAANYGVGTGVGVKDNPNNSAAITTLQQTAANIQSGISTGLGGTVNSGGNATNPNQLSDIAFSVDDHNGVTVRINQGATEASAQSMQQFNGSNAGLDTANYLGIQMLQRTTFANSDAQLVANNTDWSSTSFNQAVGNINFANNFMNDATSMIKGTMTIDKDYATSMKTIEDWANTATSLFGKDATTQDALIQQAANSMYSRIGTMNANGQLPKVQNTT